MVSLSNRYVTPWGPLFCRLKSLVLTARALSCEFHEVSSSLNPIFGSTSPVLVTWFTLAAEFFVWSPFRRLSYCKSVLWPEQKVRLLCPPQWPPACGLRGQSKSRCAASVSHMPRPKECKIRVSFGWIPPASFSSFPTWSLGNFKLQISLGSSEVKPRAVWPAPCMGQSQWLGPSGASRSAPQLQKGTRGMPTPTPALKCLFGCSVPCVRWGLSTLQDTRYPHAVTATGPGTAFLGARVIRHAGDLCGGHASDRPGLQSQL